MRLTWIVLVALPTVAMIAAACASERPPLAELGSGRPDPAGPDAAPKPSPTPTGEPVDGGRTCFDSDAAALPGCSCPYQYNSVIRVDLPCGFTLCSDLKQEAAVCSPDGHLSILPGYSPANCPRGLPPCDAGTSGNDLDAATD